MIFGEKKNGSVSQHSTKHMLAEAGVTEETIAEALDVVRFDWHMIAVGLAEEEDGKAFVQALAARDVLVDHRPEMGLRVSPHFYTTAEELSAFAEHMSELRSSGSWQAHQNEASAY